MRLDSWLDYRQNSNMSLDVCNNNNQMSGLDKIDALNDFVDIWSDESDYIDFILDNESVYSPFSDKLSDSRDNSPTLTDRHIDFPEIPESYVAELLSPLATDNKSPTLPDNIQQTIPQTTYNNHYQQPMQSNVTSQSYGQMMTSQTMMTSSNYVNSDYYDTQCNQMTSGLVTPPVSPHECSSPPCLTSYGGGHHGYSYPTSYVTQQNFEQHVYHQNYAYNQQQYNFQQQQDTNMHQMTRTTVFNPHHTNMFITEVRKVP